MKNSVLSKIMLGTMLATTLCLSSAPAVLAKADVDGVKLAVSHKEDSILLKGDVSLTDKSEKVSLSLRDSDVEQVLRMFADIAGLNIIFYDKISSKITLDIVDEPVNTAFDLVMELSQLTYSVINGNTLVIAKNGSDINMMKQGITFIPVKYVDAASMADFLNKNIFGMKKPGLAGSDIVITNPVTNELLIFGTDNDVSIAKRVVEKFDKKPTFTAFKVNYTTPKEMATMICDMLLPTTIKNDSISDSLLPLSTGLKIAHDGYITGGASGSSLELGAGEVACTVKPTSSAGNLTSFELQNFSISYQEQNGLINMIGGSDEQIAMVSEFIQKFDRKIPQAYLEVSIIELSESGSKTLSNTWQFYSDVFSFNAMNGTTSTNFPIWFFGQQLPTFDSSSGSVTEFPKDTNPQYSKPSLVYSVSYALRNSKGRVVANPRILVTNGEESTIDLTSDYISDTTTEMTASGTGSFATRTYNTASDNGIKVSVTPFISPDGYVTMDIKPDYATIAQRIMANDGYGEYIAATLLQRRNLELTNVRLKDGETLVIGGMIKEEDTKTVSKIPGLGDIPYLGALFRSSTTEKAKEEMIIMITPKIIYDDEDL